MRSEEEVNAAIERYGDTVRRLCMVHLKNEADTQDIFQTVFLKYVLSSVRFESPEHEKAWLIRVTLNACRDLLKSFFHNRVLPLEAAAAACTSGPEDSGVLQAVLSLPPKIQGCHLPSLLRRLHCSGDWTDFREEREYRLYSSQPCQEAAPGNAGR